VLYSVYETILKIYEQALLKLNSMTNLHKVAMRPQAQARQNFQNRNHRGCCLGISVIALILAEGQPNESSGFC
jgi:hypothetical protein